MGTPAFPDLGKHCSVDECKLIDFLPFTCDCCNKVFCLEHRSYITHKCPKANKNNRTVVICPLCAKGVHLIPNQDPNITWESHVNTDCDPSNYEKATKKKKCPVRGCRETLTFSNTIKCRDCTIDHCLKHRLGLDHGCPGPKKPEPTFPFWGFSSITKQDPPPSRTTPSHTPSSSSSSSWTTSLLKAVSSLMVSSDGQSEVGPNGGSGSRSGGSGGQVEECPICNMKFSKVAGLIDHVQMVHEKKGVMKVTVDVCPKCSKGFRDPVALVEHVEKEHRVIYHRWAMQECFQSKAHQYNKQVKPQTVKHLQPTFDSNPVWYAFSFNLVLLSIIKKQHSYDLYQMRLRVLGA